MEWNDNIRSEPKIEMISAMWDQLWLLDGNKHFMNVTSSITVSMLRLTT